MSSAAKAYIGFFIVLGGLFLVRDLLGLASHDFVQFLVFLAITLIASGMKVSLPGVSGTMSIYFIVLLIGIVRLDPGQTMILGIGATLVQSFWHARRRPTLAQTLFNVASMSLAIASADATYHSAFLRSYGLGVPTRLALAATDFFVMNTAPIAIVIALTEHRRPFQVWRECYFWCFPYYIIGASIAWMYDSTSLWLGWDGALFLLPLVYLIFRSYRLYMGRLESEKQHAQEMASLHLRTIEALALAIDAKDHTTHEHLQRVQVYAVEIAKEMGLSEDEENALQAASLLHDIGKLAVPEHIISKPGRLTPEEFEKMKIHPIVGAEILERVDFPYPVVPIVRAHHEKWDGSGYPEGLKGEQIPVGARILAAVDCLDALASERQYRRALPLDKALEFVVGEAGKSFDPRVIDILARRCREFEQKTWSSPRVTELGRLSRDIAVKKGEKPGAGFAAEETPSPTQEVRDAQTFLSSIAAARQEVQALFELAQDLGQSLSLSETLSVLASRLKRIIPYDAIAIYVMRDGVLHPEFVAGEDFALFSSLAIPSGQGLSGWVAGNNKPIVNGNPSVEPSYLNDPSKFSRLLSALAIPLESPGGVVGVLALYHARRDAFSRDQLRVLQAVSPKLSVSIENALRYKAAETSATTDYLTGLPNARSLFLHLDAELARCRRAGQTLTVLVCDLDGFKQVNDRLGHLTGNKLLEATASGLRHTSREYDYVARMGGDEFVLVLPGLSPESVPHKIRVIEDVVLRTGQSVCEGQRISVSVGASHFPTHGDTAEDLLAEADRQMYLCKQQRSASVGQAGDLLRISARLGSGVQLEQ
jgi:diguanylate cyclase (GGDEF)-like protein/putative nucleotidyltransferase with HDIG domain